MLGFAGPRAANAKALPHVEVGGFAASAPAPFPLLEHAPPPSAESADSVEALCAAFLARARPEVERARKEMEDGRRFPDGDLRATCEPTTFFEEDGVSAFLLERNGANEASGRLGVTYDGKAWTLAHELWRSGDYDPCPHEGSGWKVTSVQLEGTPGGRRTLVARVHRWEKVYDEFSAGEPGASTRTLEEVRCVLGPSGPSCTAREIARRKGTESLSDLESVPPLPW